MAPRVHVELAARWRSKSGRASSERREMNSMNGVAQGSEGSCTPAALEGRALKGFRLRGTVSPWCAMDQPSALFASATRPT